MTHRERLVKALSHEEPDRVPFDLGSSSNTGITVQAYERLKKFLGIDSPTRILDKPFQLADLSQDGELLEKLGIDTRGVFPRPPVGWEDRVYPDGSYEDEWGLRRSMPEGGFYYDVVCGPFWKELTYQALDKFPFPDGKDPSRVRGVKEEILNYHVQNYGVVVNVRGGFITQSQLMRGFEGWLTDIILNPEPLCDLMDRALQYQIDLAHSLLRGAGDKVDVVVYGDDVGTQQGLMVSPQIYRKYLKPRQHKLFRAIREETNARIHYHTCGSIYPLVPDFIEIGVDILNPVQVSAKDMDPARLKREFGDKLSFWGGVDTQRVLPQGSPEEVKEEVRRRIKEMGKSGGYILGAVHNIQPDVPPENIVAMFKAGREFSY
ncbi:MAG: uroporphyrinogen decarboxylase family protein [Atribacterales bacterium]